MLPKFVETFLATPTEKTAGEFLKCLANCDIYVPIVKKTYTDAENALWYPMMKKDADKTGMLIYSREIESPNDDYVIVKMDMQKVISIYDALEKLNIKLLILDEDSNKVRINDAFVRYLKMRGKRSLF